jgi:molybdopterin adenylyltransferase
MVKYHSSQKAFMELKFGVLTVSDKGARGEREDKSGQVIKDILGGISGRLVEYAVVLDEKEIISARLAAWADGGKMDIVITTGGTGLAVRDVTPEATDAILDKPVPGIAEAMRAETLRITPAAMLSRSVSGIRGKCLIINLPGSPKAVRECLEAVLPAIGHAVEIITGAVTEHSTPNGIKG